MNYNLKRPCTYCPFRTDCRKGWLGKIRAVEIVNSLSSDRTFACHKTLREDNEGNTFVDNDSQHCAGALLVLDKEPGGLFSNLLIRLAARFGGFKLEQLDQKATTFNSFKDFVNHHQTKPNSKK